jgi:hypothetical protein
MPPGKSPFIYKNVFNSKNIAKMPEIYYEKQFLPLVWPTTLSFLRKWDIGGVNLPPYP